MEAARIAESDRAAVAAKTEVESNQRRIDDAVFELYGVSALPAEEPTLRPIPPTLSTEAIAASPAR